MFIRFDLVSLTMVEQRTVSRRKPIGAVLLLLPATRSILTIVLVFAPLSFLYLSMLPSLSFLARSFICSHAHNRPGSTSGKKEVVSVCLTPNEESAKTEENNGKNEKEKSERFSHRARLLFVTSFGENIPRSKTTE